MAASAVNPKAGARFSRESVRILKNWLSTHDRHSLSPNEDEKEMLQRQTGLNKTQITNSARQRSPQGQGCRPSVYVAMACATGSNAIDIPRRGEDAPR